MRDSGFLITGFIIVVILIVAPLAFILRDNTPTEKNPLTLNVGDQYNVGSSSKHPDYITFDGYTKDKKRLVFTRNYTNSRFKVDAVANTSFSEKDARLVISRLSKERNSVTIWDER